MLERFNQKHAEFRASSLAIGLLLLVLASSGLAAAAEFGADETYRLPVGERIEDDLYVAASEIYIDGTVDGDLFAAGGYVEINGEITNDLFVAGGGVVLNGTVGDDLRAVGGGFDLNGAVGDDLLVVGGGNAGFPIPFRAGNRSINQGIRLATGSTTAGDAVIAGGSAEIRGRIAGDLYAALGTLFLSAGIGGDANITADDLQITSESTIDGVLTYTAPEEIVAEEQANSVRYQPSGDEGPGLLGRLVGWVLRTILILIGFAALGWLVLRLAPGGMVAPAEALNAEPLESGLYGLVTAVLLIFIPLASMLLVALMATFWGWFPAFVLGVFLFGTLALVWFLSPLITGLWLGRRILARAGSNADMLLAFLTGMAILVLLGRIPVLGWLVYLVSFILALGALLRTGRQRTGEPAPPSVATT